MKTCSWCRKEKPLSEFNINRNVFTAQCKTCLAIGQKKYSKISEKKCAKPGMKICTKCKVEKPFIDFYADQENRGGYSSWCQKCAKKRNKKEKRDTRLFYEYGINSAQYDLILKSQSGVCAICGQPETLKRNDEVVYLSVDHDHKTHKIRGLLCHKCNRGLGEFNDSPELLQKAQKYLEKQT